LRLIAKGAFSDQLIHRTDSWKIVIANFALWFFLLAACSKLKTPGQKTKEIGMKRKPL